MNRENILESISWIKNSDNTSEEKRLFNNYHAELVADLSLTNDSDGINQYVKDLFQTSQRSYFTICSKDDFSILEKSGNWLKSIIYTPLNDHSRKYLHKGDVVFCYRQGQFSDLSTALDKRGIYGIGFVASEPKELYHNKTNHEKYGVCVVFPFGMGKHLELRNIQLNPRTIDLTPYNGNRNDALQYIEKFNHSYELLKMICKKNPDIKKSLEYVLDIDIKDSPLPDDFWMNSSTKNENKILLHKSPSKCARQVIDFVYEYDRLGKIGHLIKLGECNIKLDIASNALPVVFYTKMSSAFNTGRAFTDKLFKINVNGDLFNVQLSNQWNGWDATIVGGKTDFIEELKNVVNLYYSNVCQIEKEGEDWYLIIKQCRKPLQQIFYGAPGTGKSRGIKDQESKFDEVIRTTFHPDTDYSTFVGAYKPIVESVDVKVVPVVLTGSGTNFEQNSGTYKEKKITYKFVKQSFLKAYISAWKGLKSGKKVLLDIEEINRGNCAQIFGDIFQLLDREEEGPMVGYSTYPIEADEDIANLLNEEFKNSDIDLAYIKDGSKLLLPNNLYIWATMNTSDQSLFPIDSAFKRRWDWKYVPIKYSNTDWKIELGDKMYSWVDFQKIINDKIKDATDGSEDKLLGDFFVKAKNNVIDENLLLNKIAFYLWNDVCKDGDGDIFKIEKDDKAEDISFSQFFKEDSILKLQQWMDYLKVDPYSDPNNNVSVQNQENIESANDEIN